jgi:hypothetical protein
MRLPRATILALTADRSSPTQPVAADRADGEYWLGHCEGFTVRSPQGLVGVVESVVYAADAPQPAYLAVTNGRLRLHTVLVPCGEVVSLDARQACLDVQARPARSSLRTMVAYTARRVSHRRDTAPGEYHLERDS